MNDSEPVTIVRYEPRYRQDFAKLNLEWLEKYFVVEAIDRQVLEDPESEILADGGEILFAKMGDMVVGTVALRQLEATSFELTKMAVTPDVQGQGIGRALMQAALTTAGRRGATRVVLYSNTVLEPAINLYRQTGFQEVSCTDPDTIYERCNIKMEKRL